MANILYKKLKRQYTDNGVSWIDMNVYKVGDVLEDPSNCQSENTKQCRWVELDLSEGYTCVGDSKYTLEVEECSTDGIIWTRTGNQREGVLVESGSSDCGYLSNDSLIGKCGEIPLNKRYRGNFNVQFLKKLDYDTNNFTYGDGHEEITVSPTDNSTTIKVENYLSEIFIEPIENVISVSNIPCSFIDGEIYGGNLGYFEGFNGIQYNVKSVSYVGIPYYLSEIHSPFGDYSEDTSFEVPNFFGINAESITIDPIYENDVETNEYTNINSVVLDLRKWDVRHLKYLQLNTDDRGKISNFNIASWKTNWLRTISVSKTTFPKDFVLDLSSFNVNKLTKFKIDVDYNGNKPTINLSNWKFNKSLMNDDRIHLQYGFSDDPIEEYGSIIMNNCDYYTIKCVKNNSSRFNIITNTSLTPKGTLSFETNTKTTVQVVLNETTKTFESSSKVFTIDISSVIDEPLYYLSINTYDIKRIISIPDTSQITEISIHGDYSGFDISNLDTRNMTDMGSMFRECSGLTSLNLSNWDTSNVTSMSYMFYRCRSLTSLDLSNWNTSNVTTMVNMFTNCTSLETLNLSGWDLTNVNDFDRMFGNNINLKKVIVSNQITENCVRCCLPNVEIENTNADEVCDDNIIIKSPYFIIQNLEVKSSDNGGSNHPTIKFKPYDDISNTLYNEHISTLGAKDASQIGLYEISSGNTNLFSLPLTIHNGISLKNVKYADFSKSIFNPKYGDFPIGGIDNTIKYLNLAPLNMDGVTSMNRAFLDYTLTSLDVSKLDTKNVTTMIQTFLGCTNLTTLDLSNWNTSKVTNMDGMFNSCESLTSLNISNFDTSKVTFYGDTFKNCTNLTSVTVANCSDTTKQFILNELNTYFTATLDGDTITVSH